MRLFTSLALTILTCEALPIGPDSRRVDAVRPEFRCEAGDVCFDDLPILYIIEDPEARSHLHHSRARADIEPLPRSRAAAAAAAAAAADTDHSDDSAPSRLRRLSRMGLGLSPR
ncbi:hypothetical protein GMORB2_2136 [Geosmithia morbida]|uniref:Uncharacterized protein n=1 Tax=Geosmithia morbida TaxID=1094350 RepID=A0A9P5D461_9HYPO|nr:uncharacterized protein GMORB2_2136 [Geosmithia morbida]KAF4121174.1 hypothetical protein GMORB2_2136 [Geosmithia morbida]